MMTPTPDPPPAGSPLGSTLTAEEIAALREQYGPENGLVHYEPQIIRLLGENAALRDRLTRAEAAERGLRRWIEAEIAEDDPPGAHDYLHGRQYALTRVLRQMEALLTTPTDGAARAGDAAGDAERRITVVFEEQKETYKA